MQKAKMAEMLEYMLAEEGVANVLAVFAEVLENKAEPADTCTEHLNYYHAFDIVDMAYRACDINYKEATRADRREALDCLKLEVSKL